MTPSLAVRVDALLAGKALPFTRPGSASAIAKHALAGEVRIGALGIEGDAPDFIKRRHVENCTKADPAYGAGVEAALRKLGSLGG